MGKIRTVWLGKREMQSDKISFVKINYFSKIYNINMMEICDVGKNDFVSMLIIKQVLQLRTKFDII